LQAHPEFRRRFEKRYQANRRVPVMRLSSLRIAVSRNSRSSPPSHTCAFAQLRKCESRCAKQEGDLSGLSRKVVPALVCRRFFCRIRCRYGRSRHVRLVHMFVLLVGP
jgi:hypothetical protein